MIHDDGARALPEVASLNSVDFRFLLPSDREGPFDHVVLLGGIPGTADRLLETNTALVVSRSTRGPSRADVLVAMSPECPDLREVADCLRPGGVLYFQISGRAHIRRLRRALIDVGLVPLATYAMRPDCTTPRVYIPLEAPGALLWYVRTLHHVPDLRSWLMNRTLTSVASVRAHLLSSLVPDVAVVARKRSPSDQAMRPKPASILSDPSLASVLGTNDLHALLVSGQRTILFPFGRNSIEPLAVVKVPKLTSQNRATENGHQALADLEQLLSPSMAASVPKPLLLLQWRGTSVSLESLMRGRSLARTFETWRISQSTRVAGLTDAAEWLSKFHRCTELSRVPWGSEQTRQWITTPTDAYRRIFGETEGERSLFARARDYAASTNGVDLPLVRQHRDFRPVNILRGEKGEIAVVDWEGYRAGPPFCDLFHFLFQWHIGARRQDKQTIVQSLETMVFEPRVDNIGDAVHRIVASYLSELRLHKALVPLLILYTVMELAIRRSEQQQREHVGADLRRGNENLEFIAVLAAHREELFGAPRTGSLLQRL